MSTRTSAEATAPAPGATPNQKPTSPEPANGNDILASAGTSTSSASPAPSSSLATTPGSDGVQPRGPSAPSAAKGEASAAAAPSTCGVCKQGVNQAGYKTCVRCRMKRNAARKRRIEQRKSDGHGNGHGGPKLDEEGTEGSVASEGDVVMEHAHEQEEGSEPLTREGSHAPAEDEEERDSDDSRDVPAVATAATTTSVSAVEEDEEDGDVEMKDEAASRALSPPTPLPTLPPPPPAPAPRPPLDVARLDAEFEARQHALQIARADPRIPPPVPPIASASAPVRTSAVDGVPCTVCKGPRDNVKYKTCATCRARSRESWRRQSAKRKALAATGGQPTPASSTRPTPTTSRANSPVPNQTHTPAPVPTTTVVPIPVHELPPPDPGAPVPGGTIVSGVGSVGSISAPAIPMLAPIPVSSGPPTPAIDPEKQRRLCSSCRSALAPPRYRTCEHCRWIARRDAAAQSGQPFTEAEPPTSRLGARRGRKRLNPAEPRLERPGKKRRVLFEVDEDEYTYEKDALEVVKDVVGQGAGAHIRVTWAVVVGEKGGAGRIARLERVAEAMRLKGIPISADSEEQEPGSSPYAGPDAVTERWACQCTHSPDAAEDDAMDVDTHANETTCGGYVFVSCGWDTHSHPAHLRGQRVTIIVAHGPLAVNEPVVVNEESQEAPVMVDAPTSVVGEA